MMGMQGLETYRKRTGLKALFILLYLLFGIYFLNKPFNFIQIPEAVLGFEQWIIFAGGVLLIIGAINYFRLSRRTF